ncbi:transferrin-binding protein-like solute binding protein [uncultured Sphingomonas sp.]|uniref:transferrin-binding protein-like solute binding protein n=1 Tax=uncultured Sphingomonas sp. TaxID=158754 RepID=UPI0035CC5CBE
MRTYLLLATASLLAACSGTGLQTIASVAPPAGSTGTATPAASFVNPTESKTYEGIGAVQHLDYFTRSDRIGQSGQLYAGDANTARDSGITIAYDPRDAIFDITINRTKGNVSVANSRFQDPLHRTAFGGLREPQAGTPNLDASKNIQYLTAGSSSGPLLSPTDPAYPKTKTDYPVGGAGYTSTSQTFFYQKPGTTTKYVTYAGFLRTTITSSQQTDTGSVTPYYRQDYAFDRAVFAYGERTTNGAVPKTGTATYTGDMIATVIFNPRPDTSPDAPNYLQWLDGSQSTTIDFASLKVVTTLTGKVVAPALDAYTSGTYDLPAGSVFTASAQAVIDLAARGGFSGTFTDAKFTRPGMSDFTVVIAGSSVDGAFFGPNGEEIGAGFRVVGGTPDQRIDILGAFTGKK